MRKHDVAFPSSLQKYKIILRENFDPIPLTQNWRRYFQTEPGSHCKIFDNYLIYNYRFHIIAVLKLLLIPKKTKNWELEHTLLHCI